MIIQKIKTLPLAVKQYLIITANYWAFTLTDGALRMLVVLYFYQLGYQPLAIAMLFLFYEVFGVITNLIGGWLGARFGLNKTMNIGLLMQVIALLMLTLPDQYLTVIWVMLAQALSGIAKDLNKMSAKSSIKTLVPNDQQQGLFRWVALLTGSKNTLKGIGFFLGALLLAMFGFQLSLLLMALSLLVIALLSLKFLKAELGKAKTKPKFKQLFSKNKSLNNLAAARMFLFAARDVWFVIAIPVYFVSQYGWQHQFVGSFMALWIIFYGVVQAFTPKLLARFKVILPTGKLLAKWALLLCISVILLAISLFFNNENQWLMIIGLFIFGGIFAINSSLHSYVIVAMARDDGISMDVGFYYMANAMGRLLGTILSGWVYQVYSLEACLVLSALLALSSSFFIRKIDSKSS